MPSPEEILAAEQRRCEALIARDTQALKILLSDDLVHVHTNGQAETKAEYLASIADKIEFVSIERETADVRIMGDTALLCGRIYQVIRVAGHEADISLPVFATIVWQRTDIWRIVSFQATLAA